MGFGKAISIFSNYYQKFTLVNAKQHLLDLLSKYKLPFIVNGDSNTLPSCVSLTFPETNTSLLIREYENEFCLAQGSACSSKEIEASHVLTALGLSREQADKTFRLSFPLDINLIDIEKFVEAIKKAT
jgi:cysteine desulfurase